MRAIALVACVAFVGLSGWLALQVDWVPELPTVACSSIFAGKSKLAPLVSNAAEPYVLTAKLLANRPPAVIQVQIIDENGFGWVNRRLEQDAPTDFRTTLPNIPDTRIVRLGLLTPKEWARANRIREAARNFDATTWLQSSGWVAPRVVLCERARLSDE